MAEGLLRHRAGRTLEVLSAGTDPRPLRPEAVEVMDEIGIDISGYRPKSVEEFAGRRFDCVITVCDEASKNCPVYPGETLRLHWGFEDPAAVEGHPENQVAAFRRVRDRLRERLEQFIDLVEVNHFRRRHPTLPKNTIL